MHTSETVEISGHLMDSGVLSRVLDDIREYEGDYVIDRFDVGHDAHDVSHAVITVSADDEGHFVPPPPPPLPVLEPRRKLAWFGLFGAPTLMLLAVIFGWTLPGWVGSLLVGSFVGGFVYLVATMQRRRPGDWSGDDGAVV